MAVNRNNEKVTHYKSFAYRASTPAIAAATTALTSGWAETADTAQLVNDWSTLAMSRPTASTHSTHNTSITV